MSVMVLGTASHVGKSLTVAAICRSLANRNITVAPFKSQNMSLNSYVTLQGDEIGIAQAMQAFAAKLTPVSEMNPILLKPKGDQISQIILHGKPWQDIQIGEYYKKTEFLLKEALSAYNRLRDNYNNIVVEGAGGAAEINLYDRDIANILLARSLKLPIIIVADIERGGVFAQIYGTIRLLPSDIRPLVIGVIINKFRGDPELFRDGIRMIEDQIDVPVLGVVPFADIPLPSEDSLSIGDKRSTAAPVRIAIIRLPRISNFTDFEVLEKFAAVEYVSPGASLDGYDCIIIPGTKNSVEDLKDLWKSGTAQAIINARSRGIPIIGICGGYQMLGSAIIDNGLESEAGLHTGLGLLDVITRFEQYHKTTVQVSRTPSPVGPILSGMGDISGYEIHMGETEILNGNSAFCGEGAVSEDGLVFGTYLHGLFQNSNAAYALLSHLYGQKGLKFQPIPSSGDGCIHGARVCDDKLFDALAEHFESYVDMKTIASCFIKKPDATRSE